MPAEGSPSSKILYPEWQNEYQAALLELDRESWRTESWRQKPPFLIGFNRCRRALTIKQNDKPLKMLWPAYAF